MVPRKKNKVYENRLYEMKLRMFKFGRMRGDLNKKFKIMRKQVKQLACSNIVTIAYEATP